MDQPPGTAAGRPQENLAAVVTGLVKTDGGASTSGSTQAQGPGLRGRTAPPPVAREFGGPTRSQIPTVPLTGCVIIASYSPALCLSLPSWEVEIIRVPTSEGCDGA